MKYSALPPKQAKFVSEYLRGGNGTRAAIEAGYAAGSAHVSASRLLKNDKVAAAVRTSRCELEAKHEMSRDRVVEELLGAIEIAKANGDTGAMIRGWSEVGKLMGYYQPNKTTQIHVNISAKRIIDQLETMSDAELLQEVERLSAEP